MGARIDDLTALPASGMAWDHKRSMGIVEVPSSWRTGLSLTEDAVNCSLLKVVTG